MLDLQGQIEALNGELRKLRGQNEELAHGLQDAEKREKDFMWIWIRVCVASNPSIMEHRLPQSGCASCSIDSTIPPGKPCLRNCLRLIQGVVMQLRQGIPGVPQEVPDSVMHPMQIMVG